MTWATFGADTAAPDCSDVRFAKNESLITTGVREDESNESEGQSEVTVAKQV
jgi:hypothetical protein